MPKEQYRVAVCTHTNKKIVQIKDNKNWLCLHKENEMLDKVSVDSFEAGHNFK